VTGFVLGLDGVSLVGKTTLAEQFVATVRGSTTIPCFSHFLARPGDRALSYLPSTAPEELAVLSQYLFAEQRRLERLRAVENASTVIVVDRTVQTLLAHTRFLERTGGYPVFEKAQRLIRSAPHIVPDHTVLLTAAQSEIGRRVRSRPGIEPVIYGEPLAAAYVAHFHDLEVRGHPVSRVDGGEQTSEVLARVLECISQYKLDL
jgi:dTMP kinase